MIFTFCGASFFIYYKSHVLSVFLHNLPQPSGKPVTFLHNPRFCAYLKNIKYQTVWDHNIPHIIISIQNNFPTRTEKVQHDGNKFR